MEHLPTRAGTSDMSDSGLPPRTGQHTREYSDLTVQALTPEMAQRTAGPYLYAVTTYGFTAHTAFRTRAHFTQWLDNLGLSLAEELVEEGCGKWMSIEGKYRVTSHLSYDEFFSIPGARIRHMDNSDYTLGILVKDADGVINLHHLNCNLRDRPVFEPAASRKLVG
jgi:hypothetical protein